jgi:hypothetical protein
MALVTFLACLPIASAMFASPKGDPGVVKDLSQQLMYRARPPQPKRELVITAETEIKVDGNACRLDQVPAGAEIILLDVTPDRAVIRKIHFQTRK